MYYSTTYQSPIGTVTLCCDGNSLTGLWLSGQKYYGAGRAGVMEEKSDLPVFNSVKKWLDRYFAGLNPATGQLPLAPDGSEFRRSVWDILREIPYGQVITYGDIAKKMAAKMNKGRMSAQAAGGAVGHNPISIIIPCHRVIGADGNLTGYAGGLGVKIKLLALEGVDTARLFMPKTTGA